MSNTMVTATEWLSRNLSYKTDFYATLKKSQKSHSHLTITSFSKSYNKREQFVLEFVKIFAGADISFEKIEYFQPFTRA
ncbi:13330_t:CDS:2, partial [Racocetra persica]